MTFGKTFRLGAFAFINNLNEKRRPGSDGGWDPAESKSGITTTKAGGVDYSYTVPDNTTNFNGYVTAQYDRQSKNSLTNVENFLSGGNTFTRRWQDALNRNLELKTENNLTLRPKSGNAYNQSFKLNADYGTVKDKSNTTEGTFGKNPGDLDGLRNILDNGWADGMSEINRFLQEMQSGRRKMNLNLLYVNTLALPGQSNGLTLIAAGGYSRLWDIGINSNNYLLQYAEENTVERLRSNPSRSFKYDYNFALTWTKPLNSYWTLDPRIDYFQNYEYKRNDWLTNEVSSDNNNSKQMLPSMRASSMLAMDMQNTYATYHHYNNIRPRLSVVYYKTNIDDKGMPSSDFIFAIEPELNIRRNWMEFFGYENVRGGKNYVAPAINIVLGGDANKMTNHFQLNYNFEMNDINPFNMIPVTMTSDPLNIRAGNPELKPEFGHRLELSYFSRNWLWNHIKLHAVIKYTFNQRQVAMGYAYNRATGVRTYCPVNVNGNYEGSYYFAPTFALNKKKSLKLEEVISLSPQRSVDMVSYDEFSSSQRSVVNTLNLFNATSLSYSVKKFMIALDYRLSKRWVRSGIEDFTPFNITRHTYGVRGRVKLPAGLEVTTDLKMFSTRGYSYPEMNTDQLVWNARITKSFAKGEDAPIYRRLRHVGTG